jgi:hypothetical protein
VLAAAGRYVGVRQVRHQQHLHLPFALDLGHFAVERGDQIADAAHLGDLGIALGRVLHLADLL